jgi:hypothetical protein
MGAETPIAALIDLVERSVRTGTKAHLPADLSRALMSHPAYARLLETRTKELIDSWQSEQPAPAAKPETTTPPVSKLGRSGSGIAANETSGASAGTIPAGMKAAVGHAASLRASAAVETVRRQHKHKTH